MGATIENRFIVILFAVSFVEQVCFSEGLCCCCWDFPTNPFLKDYIGSPESKPEWKTECRAELEEARSLHLSFQDRPESCPGETAKRNNLYTTGKKKMMGKNWSCCATTDRFVVLFFLPFFFFLQEILSQDSAQLIEKSYLLTRLGLNLSSATQVPVFSFLFCCHCNSWLNPVDRVELLADTSESELAFCYTSSLCGCHCSQ